MLAKLIATLAFVLVAQAATTTIDSTKTPTAQASPTITLFLPDTDPQHLVASIISANSIATAISVDCAPSTNGSSCGLGSGYNLTVSSQSTWIATLSDTDFTYSLSCVVKTSQSSAICVASAGGGQANFPGVITSTLDGTTYASAFMPATVTAGGDKLASSTSVKSSSSATATTTTTGSSSGSTSKPSGNAAVAATRGGEWRFVLAVVCLGVTGLGFINFL